MSTIEQELADWAGTRHPWQQYALRRIATGQPFAPADVVQLADELIAGKHTSPEQPALTASDISGVADPEATVALKAIRDLTNVNALIGSQELTFAVTGLTVVFGDNGSGKSGYARIIKDIASARHHESIHGNVFEANIGATQKADITFHVNGNARTSQWPGAADELRTISFYDEACGDTYLSSDSELTYRPSALVLVDDLIALCDALRTELDRRVTQANGAKGSLPSLATGTSAGSFLSKLMASTTKAELDAACELPMGWEGRYSWLVQEEGRLRSTNPMQERTRLQDLSAKVGVVSKHVRKIGDALSDANVDAAAKDRKSAIDLRAAADIASSGSFDDEPLPGVGSVTWRSLWDAARRYSEQEAYTGKDFPVTSEGAHCVLCQQVLRPDASGRLGRFHAFLTDTTATSADEAEEKLARLKQDVNKLEPIPAPVSSSLVLLEGEAGELAKNVSGWLAGAAQRRDALLARLEGAEAVLSPLGKSQESELADLETTLLDRAKEIDVEGFNAVLEAVRTEKDDLQSRKALSDARADVEAEIKRLGKLAQLTDAKRLTDTTHISRKASELTEEHVTTLVRDRFIRESDRLSLEHIELKRTGGAKGKIHHRPSLLGAKMVRPVDEVLSEGEQTALGLAGYFTEAHFDESKSALVLDDPVTSLDHIRRAQVAESLVRFAQDRQVVIFTHDLAFLRDLMTAAEERHVHLAERTVQRLGASPGQVSDGYPWKAKDVKRRFDELGVSLAKLKKDRPNLTQEAYEDECAKWAGKLSETWERIISLELIAPVVDPVTDFIRPASFRVLARITDADNDEFQQSYSRCSTWLRRHDKSQTMNYVAREPPTLETELTLVMSWYERVRKYKA